MEDKKAIGVLDMGGSQIVKGSVVRYMNTGSIGRVTEIMVDDEGTWVMMGTTGLYYKPGTLVLADESDLKQERLATSNAKDAESYVRSQGTEAGSIDIGQVTGGG